MISTLNQLGLTFAPKLVYRVADAFGMHKLRAYKSHGDTNRPTGLSVFGAALSRQDIKLFRLYERGASKRRIGLCLALWLGWGFSNVEVFAASSCSDQTTGHIGASPSILSSCGDNAGDLFVVWQSMTLLPGTATQAQTNTSFSTVDVSVGDPPDPSIVQVADTYTGDCVGENYQSTSLLPTSGSHRYCARFTGTGPNTLYVRFEYDTSTMTFSYINNQGWWYDVDSATTYVDLVGLRADAAYTSIVVAWDTAMEIDHSQFHLWRGQLPYLETQCSLHANDYAEVKPIASRVATGDSSSYSFEDYDVIPGPTFCYALESIDLFGYSTFHLEDLVSATLP